ncbi:MAG: FAD-dependent oxidoreductase [Candidatus Bathyarchaeia archaeon]
MHEVWDLLIIGAGPAGLAAGIYGARMGLKTLIVAEVLGGMAADALTVENYPGFAQISGFELMDKMRRQAEAYGAILNSPETVLEMVLDGSEKKAKTDASAYSAKALIIATGCTHRKLGVPGEDKFRGRGVSYCATCDGRFFRGKKVMVVGGGNVAAHEVLYLKDLASKIYLVHRREGMRADAILEKRVVECGVEAIWNSEVRSIEGNDQVSLVRVYNKKTGEDRAVEVDGVFIAIGELPRSEVAKKAGVPTNAEGYIIVDGNQETKIQGVYAAGSVTGSVNQIGVAVGEGITAAVNAYLYVNKGWYRHESSHT